MPWAKNDPMLVGNQYAKGHKPNETTFKKGQTPWNKGLKGVHFSPKSEFKKGQKSQNKLPLWSITIRTDNNKKKRRFIKIAEPNTWEEYAKWLWKQEYGNLIDGDITHHLDGDPLHDEKSNIIAIPRADHPKYHGRWGLKPISQDRLEFYLSRYTLAEKSIERECGGLF